MTHARFLSSLASPSLAVLLGCSVAGFVAAGCGSDAKQKDAEFHTSGSRDADQRAEENVAKVQQLRGEGMNQSDTHRSLYERLGETDGLNSIVSDWVDRAIADPTVNWKRQGITTGGVLGVGAKSVEWKPTKAKIDEMKKHIVQYLTLKTGGPAHYDGRDMKSSHANMKITENEFESSVGDLKAALDAHRVQTQEQKELLAIVELTKPEMVEDQ